MINWPKLDWITIVVVFLLLGIGLTVLYTISSNSISSNSIGSFSSFGRQLIAVFLGAILMFIFVFYDYRIFNSFSTKLYFLMLILLLAVVFFGTTVRGTTGWLKIGVLNFQPVEAAKIIIIIFLASFLSKKKTEFSITMRIISSIVLVFIPVFMILKQPDLGSALVIVGIWIGMLLASEIKKKNMIILGVFGLAVVFFSWFTLQNYQTERISNFLNPYNDPRGSGYNVIQSMIAVGSGGMWGKGLGHGSQSQLNFLPEKHTDFIFAVISEELGFVGAFVVLVLFAIFLFRLKETAVKARDNLGYLICVGFLTMIFLQVVINIGMNIGLAPVTGLPLPFLSYGGSSIITILSMVGITLNIHRRRLKTLD